MIKRFFRALCVAVVCFVAGHLLGCSSSVTTSVGTPTPSDLVITTSSISAGIQGQAYTATIAAKNGTAPYSFTISQGLIPTGFVMYSNGTLSGTPTKPGTYSFTVLVTDANKQQATAGFSITIAPPLAISTTTLPAGLIKYPYATLIGAVNGTSPNLVP